MSVPLVCLGCGGTIEEGHGIPDGDTACTCPPVPSSIEAVTVTCPACGGPLRIGARACPHCRSTVGTQRCGGCMAWNLADARHCQGCGDSLGAPSVSGAKVAVQCPRCEARLAARRYGDLDADECDACGGMFVIASAFEKLVGAHDTPRAMHGLRLALPAHGRMTQTDAVRYIHCPACGNMMNRECFGRISGVVVDVCRSHGVWFDAGELTEVLAFIETGGLARAKEHEQKAQAEAKKHAAHVPSAYSMAASADDDHHGNAAAADPLLMVVRAFLSLWR